MILNLTQHTATAEQVAAGVIDVGDPDNLRHLLTVPARELLEGGILSYEKDGKKRSISPQSCLRNRATALAMLAKRCGADKAMIGGLPVLMNPIETALRRLNITPLYAVSDRVSEDQPQPDGTVKKVAVFRHLGFIEAGIGPLVR